MHFHWMTASSRRKHTAPYVELALALLLVRSIYVRPRTSGPRLAGVPEELVVGTNAVQGSTTSRLTRVVGVRERSPAADGGRPPRREAAMNVPKRTVFMFGEMECAVRCQPYWRIDLSPNGYGIAMMLNDDDGND